MAVTIDDIKDLHLDSSPSIAALETIEVSHSLWPTPIRIVTNHADGVNAMLETGESSDILSLRHY